MGVFRDGRGGIYKLSKRDRQKEREKDRDRIFKSLAQFESQNRGGCHNKLYYVTPFFHFSTSLSCLISVRKCMSNRKYMFSLYLNASLISLMRKPPPVFSRPTMLLLGHLGSIIHLSLKALAPVTAAVMLGCYIHHLVNEK